MTGGHVDAANGFACADGVCNDRSRRVSVAEQGSQVIGGENLTGSERELGSEEPCIVSQNLFFVLSWVILAAALFYPVYRLILVLSVRRLQRKLERELDELEMRGQANRARVLTTLVVFAFSFLFNLQTVGLSGN